LLHLPLQLLQKRRTLMWSLAATVFLLTPWLQLHPSKKQGRC